MDRINTKLVQLYYNALISQANYHYNESNKPKIQSAGLSSYFLGKSEAYEHAAGELRTIIMQDKIFLKPEKTLRQFHAEEETQLKLEEEIRTGERLDF